MFHYNHYIGNYTPLYQIMSDYVQIIYYYKKLYLVILNYKKLYWQLYYIISNFV